MLYSIIFIFIFTAGCHRFVLGNFTDDSIDELKAHEVQEFDAPSEVGRDRLLLHCIFRLLQEREL